MTHLELFRKTVAREYTGRYLYHCGFIGETFRRFREHYGLPEDMSMGERFGTFEPWSIELKPPEHAPAERDFTRYFRDIDIKPGSFINNLGVLEVPGGYYHFTQYISPLRNITRVEECWDFPFDYLYGHTEDGMRERVEQAHKNGKAATMHAGSQYEPAWQIRGYQEFLMDMVSQPEIPFYILGRIHDQELKKFIAAAKAGVDIIHSGDDIATQRALIMSPDLWRKFIKPLHKQLNDTAHAINPGVKILYHSDGDVSAVIPDLIDMGVDILNPLQPECMDLGWLKREYGKHLIFDGTIGTQSTMPFGTPDDVRRAVAESKSLYGYDGGLMIAPTHVLEPEVPPENIMAFLEECAKD